MDRNIVLIGLMGSGKTTLGKLLSLKLEMDFIDTDVLIEKEAKKTINEIFEMYGETLFRKLETKTIKTVSKYSDKVISTGGGAVENPKNMENLKKNSVLFYLYAPANELYDRVKNDKHRPLLKTHNPVATLKHLLKKREQFYNQADFVINTVDRPSNEIIDEIIENYNAL